VAKSEWKDISSYSQSDKDRKPTTFERHVGKLRLVVTRHIHYPNKWVIRSDGIFEHLINDCNTDQAKDTATDMLKKCLEAALKEL